MIWTSLPVYDKKIDHLDIFTSTTTIYRYGSVFLELGLIEPSLFSVSYTSSLLYILYVQIPYSDSFLRLKRYRNRRRD